MPIIMKLKPLFFILFSAMIVAISPANPSQEDFSIADQAPKQNEFDSMKSQISQLIEENKKLEVEYSLLYSEFENVVQQIKERRNEVAMLEQKAGMPAEPQAEAPSQSDGNSNELLVLESRINFLKTRLGNLEDQIAARTMQIKSLQYQKGELEIDVKMKNYQIVEKDKKSSGSIEALKTDLQKIQAEEQAAVERIAVLQEEKQSYPQKIKELQDANKDLKDKIATLEKKREIRQRESANLKDKKLLEQLLSEKAMSVKEEEKAKLEASLKTLENEYNHLDRQVSSTLQNNDENQAMLKNLIQVDKENQDLRDRIVALKEKIGELKKK